MPAEDARDEGFEGLRLAVEDGALVVVDLAVGDHAVHVGAQHLLALVVPRVQPPLDRRQVQRVLSITRRAVRSFNRAINRSCMRLVIFWMACSRFL